MRLAGNQPFIELVLDGENQKTYRVVGKLEPELRGRVPVYIHLNGRVLNQQSRYTKQSIEVESYGFPEI